MPKIVFKYFDIKGIGEVNRILLAYGDEEFEEIRVTVEQWFTSDIKQNTLFGQLPTIEFEGKTYAQNTAIARYLGKKYGLGGANLLEDLEIDMNIDFLNDIRLKAAQSFYEMDKEHGRKLYERFSVNDYPFMLETLNKIVVQNGGHLALGKLTWADFMFAGMYDYLKHILRMPELDKQYPAFKKLRDEVYSLPKVAAYVSNLPKIAMVELPY